ncbi:MAG: SpoIIE family protein phosphatase [Sulfuricella sp.]|nr:SpoIIE family protein phosphatase [Sulfuricella sp.]
MNPFRETLRQVTVLYVEDDHEIRMRLWPFLAQLTAHVFAAENGLQGLQIFREENPDVVITDIVMPVMDGMKMAEAIKREDPSKPVIFTTAFDDSDFLHAAIEIGVDGYVSKPISVDSLITAIGKSAALLIKTRELMASRAQLEAYHQAAEEEKQLVAELMARMMCPGSLHDEQLQYYLQPADVVSGDLVAVSRSRHGKLYVMLADSTGHGLPAALNLLPVNHIFYSMVAKDQPVSLMVEEMNWAVKKQSPTGRYVAAVVACIDTPNRLVEIWNGGIPTAYFFAGDGSLLHTFRSVNLPLGILDQTFTAQMDIFQWQDEPGHLLIYSDGFIEAENESGEPFGVERIKEVFRNEPVGKRFDMLQQAVTAHLGTGSAFDDMTLLLVDCAPSGRPNPT